MIQSPKKKNHAEPYKYYTEYVHKLREGLQPALSNLRESNFQDMMHFAVISATQVTKGNYHSRADPLIGIDQVFPSSKCCQLTLKVPKPQKKQYMYIYTCIYIQWAM